MTSYSDAQLEAMWDADLEKTFGVPVLRTDSRSIVTQVLPDGTHRVVEMLLVRDGSVVARRKMPSHRLTA